MVRKRSGFTPVPNDPYKSAGRDIRNGDIKILDKDGKIKRIVANDSQFRRTDRTWETPNRAKKKR